MSVVTAIINGLIALKELFKLGMAVWESIREMKRQARENQALRGNENGNTIDIEQGLGNPDAGKPSGIGQVRDKTK